MDGKKAIYITPGVNVEYEIALDDVERKLQFSYGYYEAAKEWGSDGAKIDIFINDELVDYILINPENELLDYSLDLGNYLKEIITLRIECHQEGDAIGDWVLLCKPVCKQNILEMFY